MTDLRQAAQQALEALENSSPDQYPEDAGVFYDTITALRTALEQQAEPVSHAVIAGALFDFMGWLTTRKERLVLSSTDNASPAADATKDFAEMRGLSLDDARVQDWQNYTTPPQRQWVGLTDEDFLEACQIAERGNYLLAFQRIQIKLKERNT